MCMFHLHGRNSLNNKITYPAIYSIVVYINNHSTGHIVVSAIMFIIIQYTLYITYILNMRGQRMNQ